MPSIKQEDAVLYYVANDGSKGHTVKSVPGHTVASPFDFLLVTEDRDEWEAWGCSDCCDCDCDHEPGCDCDCGCENCDNEGSVD